LPQKARRSDRFCQRVGLFTRTFEQKALTIEFRSRNNSLHGAEVRENCGKLQAFCSEVQAKSLDLSPVKPKTCGKKPEALTKIVESPGFLLN
jgi:hypothetical protein